MTKKLTKLLFVDDDRDIITIAKYCLEYLKDVEVHFLSSGEEAVKEALAFQPDLILLDVMMPVMDGVATFKAMKVFPSLALTPVVFITAKLQKDEIDEYLKLGAIDVIKKPFDPLTLSDTILKIWDKHQSP